MGLCSLLARFFALLIEGGVEHLREHFLGRLTALVFGGEFIANRREFTGVEPNAAHCVALPPGATGMPR